MQSEKKKTTENRHVGTSGGVMVCKLDLQSNMSELESHWVPHSYGRVQRLREKLSKL